MTKRILCIAFLAAAVVAAADKDPKGTKEPAATAALEDAAGNSLGTVEFFQTKNGVRVKGDLMGLPAGEHAFHIHETGKCDAPDFKSAGGHFNPTDAKHGSMTAKDHHAGDMPNIKVAADGKVELEVLNKSVTTEATGKTSLFKAGGTAVVIHSGADDYKSQPAGDAGDRIACGVIEKAH